MKNVALSITKFFSEVRLELLRIEWPSLNEFIGSTFVVLIIICAFAVYLGVIDRVILAVMQKIFAYGAA